MRRLLATGLLLASLAAAACGATGGPPPAPAEPGSAGGETTEPAPVPRTGNGGGLALKRVVSGLDYPVHVATAPGEPKRLYVVEQPGRIRVVVKGRIAATFLDLRDIVSFRGERGLLSMAFHPGYATNRLFYVNYTDLAGDTRVVEYRARSGGSPVKTRELLFVDQPYSNHNGGQLQFGPDGFLYAGMGDGGAQGDPDARSQDLSSKLGKLLRLDVDSPGADWELVGYGLRNPWRFSFDRLTGDLYIGDVGQNEWEEIDFTSADSPGLENYGWDAFEGNHEFEPGNLNPAGKLVAPIYEYGRSLGCSVTGGYVYRGGLASARGRYFFGDYCTGKVWSFAVRNGRATDVRTHRFTVEALTSFGEGSGGALYLVSHEGRLYRLVKG
jgi:hypothetical protein